MCATNSGRKYKRGRKILGSPGVNKTGVYRRPGKRYFRALPAFAADLATWPFRLDDHNEGCRWAAFVRKVA